MKQKIYAALCRNHTVFTLVKYILFPFLKISETFLFLITAKNNRLQLNGWLRLHGGGKIEQNNYGDDLNYFLLKKLTGRKIFNWRLLCFRKNIENIVCIGSILQLPQLRGAKCIVWGTGCINGVSPPAFNPIKVLAVRGPLTRNVLMNYGIECPEVYGDPALLLPFIYKPISLKQNYKIGFIPHRYDKNSPLLQSLAMQMHDSYVIIDLSEYGTFESVIDTINSCKLIVSSSLHGLIIADAYNIPNVWVELSDNVEGNGFKFRDYFLSVGRANEDAFRITEETSITELYLHMKKWTPITFDAQKLLDTFPYEIHRDALGNMKKGTHLRIGD